MFYQDILFRWLSLESFMPTALEARNCSTYVAPILIRSSLGTHYLLRNIILSCGDLAFRFLQPTMNHSESQLWRQCIPTTVVFYLIAKATRRSQEDWACIPLRKSY